MPIDLDTRVAIRHPDLKRVVKAVVEADEHDEAEWLEWKSSLDLSTKEGCFPVARTILGMANRMPSAASHVCEGVGYIIVGAEPGNLVGVASVDPAELDQIFEPWLGGVEGPRYTAGYVAIEGTKVLVVVVEAPKNGDPIYALRKEFERYRDGDVFVRKPGRTDRAKSADLKALTERATRTRAATPGIEVSLVGDVPLSWMDRNSISSAVATWLGDRRAAMESAAQAEERLRHPESEPVPQQRDLDTTAAVLADYQRQQQELAQLAHQATRLASAAGLVDEPDKRTLDEYLAEVETWSDRVAAVGPAVLLDRYLGFGHGLVAVRVHNPSGRYLPKVMVEVHFEWDQVSSPEREYGADRLPAEPRPYGQPTPSALARSLSYSPQFLQSITPSSFDPTPRLARSWTEEGSVKIVFEVGDLRQEDTETSDDHYLFMPERPPDGTLHGTWKATIPEVDGVIRGTLEVAVCEDPVDLSVLLDHEPVDED